MVGTQLEAYYEQSMTGEGLTYLYRQRIRVQCPECGVDLAAGLMAAHRKT